jgi:hypothetical protein
MDIFFYAMDRDGLGPVPACQDILCQSQDTGSGTYIETNKLLRRAEDVQLLGNNSLHDCGGRAHISKHAQRIEMFF